MDKSKDYFLDEVRDGFFIPSMMKKAWAVNLKNYKELEAFSRQHGLTVSATWGSLLGAVRHGGFIPWDDDIDTAMIRNDYNRLKKISDSGELPGDHNVSDYEFNQNDNLTRGWIDSKYLVRTPDDILAHYGFPLINIIDIFILDYVPRDKQERELYINIIQLAVNVKAAVISLENQKKMTDEELAELPKENRVDESEVEKGLAAIEKYIGYSFDKSEENPLFIQLLKAIDKLSGSYGIDKCDELAMMSYYMDNPGRIVPRGHFSDVIDMDFEGETIAVPIGYDGILNRYWGKYMYPVLNFGGHGYPYYKYMEEDVIKYGGMEFLYYHPSIEDYEENISKKEERASSEEVVKNTISLLKEAHGYISENCTIGIITNDLLEVLENCQDLAISVGNKIETTFSGSSKSITILEEYCENVYKLYQMLTEYLSENYKTHIDNDYINQLSYSLEKLENIINRFECLINEDMTALKEIREFVFLTYRVEHWKALHTIWEAACKASQKDDSIRVIAIKVPYYFKNYDGTYDREKPILEEGYPKDVEFLSYDEYDFELRHPAAIIYTCPYDEYNEAMSIHPYYYSVNLQKYTDNMVFVPPFALREISEADERAQKTLSEFIFKPGVLYADHIYVQSSEMKETYTRLLSRFIEDELKDERSLFEWSSRIIGLGSACVDWEARKRLLYRVVIGSDNSNIEKATYSYYCKDMSETNPEIYDDIIDVPYSWINRFRGEHGEPLKIVMYYLSGSMLYEHGVSEVDRAEMILSKLSKRGDIVVIWHVDKYARQILKKHNLSAWNAFRRLRDEFVSGNMGILDETWDEKRTAKIADIYVGDASVAMNDCRVEKKPVLWTTPGIWDAPENEDHTWCEETMIAVEGDNDDSWSVERFIEEAVNCKRIEKSTSIGQKIWESIEGNDHESVC